MDWNAFVEKVQSLPANTYKLHSPCGSLRMQEVQLELGSFPSQVSEMLRCCNGAELFINYDPLLTLFGLYQPDLPPQFANYDWYIDRWSRSWRSKMHRPDDWVIGMYNYGTVVVLGADLLIREWDSAQRNWSHREHPWEDWLERVIAEGCEYLNEE
jgi:hypothetical protein